MQSNFACFANYLLHCPIKISFVCGFYFRRIAAAVPLFSGLFPQVSSHIFHIADCGSPTRTVSALGSSSHWLALLTQTGWVALNIFTTPQGGRLLTQVTQLKQRCWCVNCWLCLYVYHTQSHTQTHANWGVTSRSAVICTPTPALAWRVIESSFWKIIPSVLTQLACWYPD